MNHFTKAKLKDFHRLQTYWRWLANYFMCQWNWIHTVKHNTKRTVWLYCDKAMWITHHTYIANILHNSYGYVHRNVLLLLLGISIKLELLVRFIETVHTNIRYHTHMNRFSIKEGINHCWQIAHRFSSWYFDNFDPVTSVLFIYTEMEVGVSFFFLTS